MDIYIIRHGESVNNAARRPEQLQADPVLTSLGLQQAAQTAEFLAASAQQFTHLYTSPMQRALQTALPIARHLHLRAYVWVSLHESGGIGYDKPDGTAVYENGLTRQQMQQAYTGFVLPEAIGENGWFMHSGFEPYDAFYQRVFDAVLTLRTRAQETPHDRLLLISHGGFIDALIKGLLSQLPMEIERVTYRHHNAAMTLVHLDEIGRPSLYFMNYTDHLPAHLKESF